MKGLIFTYVLTYGGAIAALANPYYGFLIYVCFGIVRPQSMWPWSVPAGNYSRIIAIALLLGWVLHGMGRWNFGRAKSIVVALVMFWCVTGVSTMLAPNREVAWTYFETLSKILLPLFVGCTLIDRIERLEQLQWVIALSQGFVAYEMNLSYFSGYNRLFREGFSSLDNNTASVSMVIGAGLAFFLMLHSRTLLRRGMAGLIWLLCTHAVMFSFSRGALLALIISAGAAFVLLPKRPIYVGAFVVALLIGLRLAGPEVVARFVTTFADQETRDASANSRIALWRACMQEMSDHPLFGLGPNHWPFVAHHHGFEYGKAAHSLWMQTGAEGGVTGLATLAAFYGLTMLRLWRLARSPLQVDRRLTAAAHMSICGLSGFIVAAQFVSIGLVEMPYYVAAIGIGTLKLASVAPVYCVAPSPELPPGTRIAIPLGGIST